MHKQPFATAVSDFKERADGQISFRFSEEPTDGVIKLTMADLFADLRTKTDLLAADYTKILEAQGHRVFPVVTENDETSIEADYGAPAHGLDFFRDLIDPTRAFRYTKLRVIEGVYKTHHQQAIAVGQFLKTQGYRVFDDLTDEQLPS